MSSNLPGRWLLVAGRFLFDRSVYDAAIVPAVADMQAEWIAATNTRERLLARWRGLVAFTSLVIVSPVAFRAWPGRDRGDGAPVITLIVLAVAGLALWQWWVPMAQTSVEVIGTGYRSWGAAAWLAVLAGPVLAGSSRLGRLHAPRTPYDIFQIPLAMACLSIALPIFFGAATLIGTFSEIGARGSAGADVVLEGLRAVTLPAFYGSLAAASSLVLVTWRSFQPRPPAERPALSGVSAMSVTLVGTLVVIAMNIVMQMHHRVMRFVLLVFAPAQQPPIPGGSATIGQESEFVVHMMLAAMMLGVLAIVFAITTWRALRDRHPPSWFIWSARAVVVIALVSTAWHSTITYRDVQQLNALQLTMTRQ